MTGDAARRAPGHALRALKLGLDDRGAAADEGPDDEALTLFSDTTCPTLRSSVPVALGAAPLAPPPPAAAASARVAHVDESPNARTPISSRLCTLACSSRPSCVSRVLSYTRGWFWRKIILRDSLFRTFQPQAHTLRAVPPGTPRYERKGFERPTVPHTFSSRNTNTNRSTDKMAALLAPVAVLAPRAVASKARASRTMRASAFKGGRVSIAPKVREKK